MCSSSGDASESVEVDCTSKGWRKGARSTGSVSSGEECVLVAILPVGVCEQTGLEHEGIKAGEHPPQGVRRKWRRSRQMIITRTTSTRSDVGAKRPLKRRHAN
jgi:hypothetical protein